MWCDKMRCELLKMKKPKYIFFDLDNTLTRSKSPISGEMKEALGALAGNKEVIVVSGATTAQILKQVSDEFRGRLWTLAQNGNFALHKDGSDLWANVIEDKEEVMNHVSQMQSLLDSINEDMIQDRGCQISLSCVGHNADINVKEKFDSDFSKRVKMLEKHPFASDKFEVRIGGTTCFDYTIKGLNKGANVARLVDMQGWNIEECLYVGDALVEGGNDETVIGVCKTHQVANPQETLQLIKNILEG